MLTWIAKVKPAEPLDFFVECRRVASKLPAPFTIPVHTTKLFVECGGCTITQMSWFPSFIVSALAWEKVSQ